MYLVNLSTKGEGGSKILSLVNIVYERPLYGIAHTTNKYNPTHTKYIDTYSDGHNSIVILPLFYIIMSFSNTMTLSIPIFNKKYLQTLVAK